MVMLYLMGGLIIITLLGMPLAYSIGLSSVISMLIEAPQFLTMIPQRIWSGSFDYVMVCMPLFMFMGELMNKSGITDNLMDMLLYIVRPIKGGLAEVNVLDSLVFGGISGSSVADVAALGSVVIPAMEKQGYPPRFAAGLTVATATMGIIVPPSIPLIMYSMISGASISDLFVAGIIPGVLVALTQLVVVYVMSKKRGYHPQVIAFNMRHFIRTMLMGLPTLFMPLVIILSISLGIATPSESAAIAVLYALILGGLCYRKLTWKDILSALRKTLVSSSTIVIIIGFSTIFSWLMTMQQVPQTVAAWFMALNLPQWAMLAIFIVVILILGCFLDVSPAILMLTPIMLPIMREIGIGDVQFGIMFISGLAIGLVTPPVGMCLNACSKINKMPITEIALGALPFIACNVFVLVLTAYIPAITEWLPTIISY